MSAAGSRPEHELLLCLARLRFSAEHRERARSLVRAGLDWGVLRSEMERHGLELLVHRHLSQEAAELCPAAVLEEMGARALAVLSLNMALTGELGRLLVELEAAGCRPIVLKGPALAMAVYCDLSSRPFTDVDIVVDPPDSRRAWDLLEALGWLPSPAVPRRWRETWLRSTHEELFRREDSPLLVDLHWELMARGYSYSMTLEEVRPRLLRVPLGPCEVSTLGFVDTLLFLCSHGIKHNWGSLSWLVDVAELVRGQPGLDWDSVRRWSRVFGRRRPLQVGLHLARRLLEAPVPAEVLADGDRDPAVAALVEVVRASFLDAAAAASRQGLWAGTVGSVWFRGMERWSDRLRHLHEWVLMPRPPDWDWLPLPAWTAPAYYVVRPLRLLLKHGGARLGRAPSPTSG